MKSHINRRGFTLIELLVVMTIILIVGSVVLIRGNASRNLALDASQRIVAGVVQGARGQAILKGAKTRLILHNDPTQLDKYRRFCGIIYEGTDRNGVDGWIAATEGTFLPEGIYFDAATSARESAAWSVGNVMSVEYPRSVAQEVGAGAEYLYYEFDRNGNSRSANAWIILRAAIMIPNDRGTLVDELRLSESDSELEAGLIIRRSGTVTLVKDPEAIRGSSSLEIN